MFNSKVWEQYYKLPFQNIKDTSLLWFQYRFLYIILATNTFLYIFIMLILIYVHFVMNAHRLRFYGILYKTGFCKNWNYCQF